MTIGATIIPIKVVSATHTHSHYSNNVSGFHRICSVDFTGISFVSASSFPLQLIIMAYAMFPIATGCH